MTYFELFNLPESYQINKSALKTAYRQLAKLQHPDVLTDNAASSSPQKILDLNEALKTLEQDDLRLAYLLKLGGLTPEEINDNKLDSAFLFDMMELSEQAESVCNNRSPEQVDVFLNTLSEQKKNVENQQLNVLNKTLSELKESGELEELKKVYKKIRFFLQIQKKVSTFASQF
jgi:molecular chaperone HscB